MLSAFAYKESKSTLENAPADFYLGNVKHLTKKTFLV